MAVTFTVSVIPGLHHWPASNVLPTWWHSKRREAGDSSMKEKHLMVSLAIFTCTLCPRIPALLCPATAATQAKQHLAKILSPSTVASHPSCLGQSHSSREQRQVAVIAALRISRQATDLSGMRVSWIHNSQICKRFIKTTAFNELDISNGRSYQPASS